MAWALHKADIPDDAKAYLSVLGSCGDERQAASEVGATEADVRRWARDDEFSAHRQQALAYYESWKGWSAERAAVHPGRWPMVGRLDQRFDPFRVARSVHDLLGSR